MRGTVVLRAEETAEGLLKFDCAPPLAMTAQRAKGYDLGLVAVLEKPEDVPVYADHPAHQKYMFSTGLASCSYAF